MTSLHHQPFTENTIYTNHK